MNRSPGSFVVETFFAERGLFDHYIALDPSLWRNREELVKRAGERLRTRAAPAALWLASSDEPGIVAPNARLVEVLKASPSGPRWHHEPMPEEKHSTI